MLKFNKDFIPSNLDKPKFFDNNSYSYLTLMGSRAYGTFTLNSDYDFYGFIVPPAEIIFPHLSGYIQGFGRSYNPFEQYQQQHVQHHIYGEIDFTIYNIVKYFDLVMMGNPNMVDSLFVDDESILHIDEVGELVRNNRHLFLSELMYHRFKGMAYSHASRLRSGHTKKGRKQNEELYGFDVKDAYHSIRILLQIKEVLETGELHLTKNAEYLNEIRSGQHNLEHVLNQFDNLMNEIELLVANGSNVPYSPNENSIKNLLVNCLEIKFGSLSNFCYDKF